MASRVATAILHHGHLYLQSGLLRGQDDTSSLRPHFPSVKYPLALLSVVCAKLAKMSQARVNAVYYPSWRVYKGKPPSCLDLSVTTHVFYAFVR